MAEFQAAQTAEIDVAALEQAARKASGNKDLKLSEYQLEPLKGGKELAVNLMRVSGTGQPQGYPVQWKLVMKTFFSQPGNADPQASHYWKREACLYSSGQLDNLPDGLRAPCWYGTIEQPDKVQVFLEDLQIDTLLPGGNWEVHHYGVAGRCLGKFNGAYLAGKRPMPAGEWIPNGWLRSSVEEAAPNIERFLHSPHSWVIKRMFAAVSTDLVRLAWETRHAFFDTIYRFPQTFCHQDAFCGNLFIDQRSENNPLVGIDWSFAGPSAAGSELVPLVVGSMPILGPIPFAETDRLADLALDGYLDGLVEAGYQPNEEQIRFVLNAGGFWRYTIGSMIGEYLDIFLDETKYESLEQAWGISMEQLANDLCYMNAWLLSRYEGAKKNAKSWNR